jgi:hypothetical protein
MNKSSTTSEVISLPQGGGALHVIGETFSPDLHTGTGNFTVPSRAPKCLCLHSVLKPRCSFYITP